MQHIDDRLKSVIAQRNVCGKDSCRRRKCKRCARGDAVYARMHGGPRVEYQTVPKHAEPVPAALIAHAGGRV